MDISDYLTPRSESALPLRMDSFDEAIENSLKAIKTKHHIRAPYTAASKTFICVCAAPSLHR